MKQRVLRWDVPVDDEWHEIGGGRVVEVSARTQRERPGDLVEVWTLEGAHVPTTTEPPMRSVIVIGTGHTAPPNTEYLGTAVVPNLKLAPSLLRGGRDHIESHPGLVWHVFGAYWVKP